MAGGEGTRLRPLSLGMPKPMVPLLGRPVMEHIIGLLKRHGIDEIAVTLCYMPEAVQSYFGDGQKWGVRLHYFIEEAPLGTAGSVRACAPFLEGEDFLVISGDSVCDLDLTAAMEFHQAKRAQATLVLFRHPAPLEYGLVLTDEEQRVVRFVEKPSWGQVVTDLVNTGIYLLSPQVLEQIPPDRPWDFGKDVFPALLESGGGLYGVPAGLFRVFAGFAQLGVGQQHHGGAVLVVEEPVLDCLFKYGFASLNAGFEGVERGFPRQRGQRVSIIQPCGQRLHHG